MNNIVSTGVINKYNPDFQPVKRSVLIHTQLFKYRLLTNHFEVNTMKLNKYLASLDLDETAINLLRFKRIGQAFSVGECSVNELKYEGFFPDWLIPNLANVLFKAEKLDQEKGFRFAGEILNSSLSESFRTDERIEKALNIIHTPSSDNVVSLAGGFDTHVTFVLFFKGHLIYCNKGADSNGGINVYKIPDPAQFNEKYLKDLANNSFTHENYLSENELIRIFNLQHLVKIQLKDQKIGNCAYSSQRAGVRSLLAIFSLLKEQDEFITSDNWIEAFEKTKENYKNFVQLDRNMCLNELIRSPSKIDDILRKDLLLRINASKMKARLQKKYLDMLADNLFNPDWKLVKQMSILCQ